MNRISQIQLLFFICLTGALQAQITAPEACTKDLTYYADTIEEDTIFIFTAISDSTFLSVDTSYKGFSIAWDEFVPGIGHQYLSSGDIIYFHPDSIAKGYRLTLTSVDTTITQRCWVFNKYGYKAEILTKDNEGNLASGAYTAICESYGPIQVSVLKNDYIYFNPVSLDTIEYSPYEEMTWEKEIDVPEGNMIPQGTIFGNIRYALTDAYWKDMNYTFIISDSCGNEARDSVFVRSIRPKAGFDFVHIKLVDTVYYPDRDPKYYFFYSDDNYKDHVSAPAQFLFINKSENAHEYVWSFGDSTSLRTDKDTVIKEYNYWGNFTVKLTAEHHVKWWNQTCLSDTVIEGSDNSGVSIDKPQLTSPNAFSVKSASYLGSWRFEDVSITDFEISIFSRSGIRVHHFKGNIRDWNGWDGHIGKSDNLASTGVYFYVVKDFSSAHNLTPELDPTDKEIFGIEGESGGGDNTKGTNIKEYRGAIHLFND